MDIGRSFSFVTEDQDWIKKILLGGLISLIPFVGPFYLMGYVFQTLQNVIAGREVPLPEVTEDFGEKLVKGIMLSVISFIYFLPISILSVCAGAGSGIFAEAVRDPDAAQTVVNVVGSCFGCIGIVYGLVVSLVLPYAWSKYAETERFGEAFKLGEIFAMLKSNIGPTIIVVLVTGVASAVAGIVGFIACIIGLIFTSFYAQLVTAFLYGSLYRQARSAVV